MTYPPQGPTPDGTPPQGPQDPHGPAAPLPPAAPGQWGAPTSSEWGAPSAGGYGQQPPPPPAADSQYGGYGQHQPSGPPQYQAPAPAPIAAQPGIIPLRPLTLGDIFDGAFKAIRANPIVMFVFAGVVVAVVGIVEAILTSTMLSDYLTFLDLSMSDPTALEEFTQADLTSMLSGTLVPILVSGLLSFLATTALNGILTLAVSQAVLGFKPSLGQVWEQAKGQLGRLLLLVLLISVITASVPLVLAGLTVLAFLSSPVLGAIASIITVLVFIAWALFITTATALATPACMLERSGPITALRRSWQLVKPNFWRVLGIYVLTVILSFVVAMFISAPLGMVTAFIPNMTVIIIVQTFATTLGTALITPFVAGVLSLLYIDIRIRREGLAHELAAAATQ